MKFSWTMSLAPTLPPTIHQMIFFLYMTLLNHLLHGFLLLNLNVRRRKSPVWDFLSTILNKNILKRIWYILIKWFLEELAWEFLFSFPSSELYTCLVNKGEFLHIICEFLLKLFNFYYAFSGLPWRKGKPMTCWYLLAFCSKYLSLARS